jgi:hypothetical protein
VAAIRLPGAIFQFETGSSRLYRFYTVSLREAAGLLNWDTRLSKLQYLYRTTEKKRNRTGIEAVISVFQRPKTTPMHALQRVVTVTGTGIP